MVVRLGRSSERLCGSNGSSARQGQCRIYEDYLVDLTGLTVMEPGNYP
jgi:hypothetical protein